MASATTGLLLKEKQIVYIVTSPSSPRGSTIHWVSIEEPMRPDFDEMPLHEWTETMRFEHDDMDE